MLEYCHEAAVTPVTKSRCFIVCRGIDGMIGHSQRDGEATLIAIGAMRPDDCHNSVT